MILVTALVICKTSSQSEIIRLQPHRRRQSSLWARKGRIITKKWKMKEGERKKETQCSGWTQWITHWGYILKNVRACASLPKSHYYKCTHMNEKDESISREKHLNELQRQSSHWPLLWSPPYNLPPDLEPMVWRGQMSILYEEGFSSEAERNDDVVSTADLFNSEIITLTLSIKCGVE